MAEHQDPSGTPEQPYTIHDDVALDPAPQPSPESPPGRTRRGPDPVALLAGLAAVAVAVLALTDTLTALDGRWLLAGGAIVVGLVVLAAASRPRTPTGTPTRTPAAHERHSRSVDVNDSAVRSDPQDR